jgi:hypothetical protein
MRQTRIRVRSLVVTLVTLGCASSVASSQVQPPPQQSGKIDPKESGKIDPRESGKIDPKQSGKIDPKQTGKIDPKQTGKIDPKQNGKIDPTAKDAGKLQPTAKESCKFEPVSASPLKRTVGFDRGVSGTAAEKAYALARLDEIDRIVLTAVPEFPRLGYPMFTQLSGFFVSAPKPNTILQYDYVLFADLGSQRYCSIFTASINHSAEGGDDPWLQGPLGKPVPGASFVLAELVPPPNPSYEQMLIVRDGETPYRQLTREEVRRWQITDDEGVNGEKLAKRKQRFATTPYEQFMAGAPERKKARDDLRVVLKGLRTPAEIDAQIKEMETVERDAAKQFKAQELEDRQQNDSISHAPSIADKARASIARMSAAERKLPAWITPGASDTLFIFGTTETPYVSRMIRPNLAFWSMHRSRVEVRTIDLDFSARCPKEPPPPEVHKALWKLRQNIDWAALKRMVDMP